MPFHLIDLVIQELDSVRLHFPFAPYHQPNRTPMQFTKIHDLFRNGDLKYNCTVYDLKHSLEPPLMFDTKVEVHLSPVFQHYLKHIPECTVQTAVFRYAICVNQQRYWLSFIEKALLCAIVCFIEPNFDFVGTGVVLMPGQLRSFLTNCRVEFLAGRCSFMTRFNATEAIRQTLFKPVLNYDDYTYRVLHRSDLLPTIESTHETQLRHVLLYFIVMCHETLNTFNIDRMDRLPYIRFMCDHYLDGETIGLQEQAMPTYLNQQHTLVHRCLEQNEMLRIIHTRISQRTVVINKFLYTGEAKFSTQNFEHYPLHVVPVVQRFPVKTKLLDNLEAPLEPNEFKSLSMSSLVDLLMHQCELKLLSELEQRVFKLRRMWEFECVVISNQLAIRIETFLTQVLRIPGDQFWCIDMVYKRQDQVLLIVSRAKWVEITLLSAVKKHRHSPQLKAYNVLPQSVSRHTQSETFSSVLNRSLLILVHELLMGPYEYKDELKLNSRSKTACLLFYHIFNNTYDFESTNTSARIVSIFKRVRNGGKSSFGNLGSCLLAWCVADCTDVYVTRVAEEHLKLLATGTGLKEIDSDPCKIRAATLTLANTFRSTMAPQRFFTRDETPSNETYTLLTAQSKAVLLNQVACYLSEDAIHGGSHPDILFCLLAMICPRVQLLRAQFDQLFPFDQTHHASISVNPNSVLFKPNCNHPEEQLATFQQKCELTSTIAALMMGGVTVSSNDSIRTVARDFINSTQQFVTLPFQPNLELLLPPYEHPGEIIDPVVMSLLLQIERREQASRQNRLKPNCVLFRPPHSNKRKWSPNTTMISPLSLSANSTLINQSTPKLDLFMGESDSDSDVPTSPTEFPMAVSEAPFDPNALL